MRKINNKSNLCGSIIKSTRMKKKISRETLCQKLQLMGLNIDTPHLYRIETNSVILKDFELIAICEILDIDYNSLKKLLHKEL